MPSTTSTDEKTIASPLIEKQHQIANTVKCADDSHSRKASFLNSTLNDNCAKDFRPLIVIGSARGGTTWLTATLNKRVQIRLSGEVLFGFYVDNCAHPMVNAVVGSESKCEWNGMRQIMENKFQQLMEQTDPSDDRRCRPLYYVGFKITIGQLPPEFLGDFTAWVYRNDISIIQLHRSATIASFWNYQSESREVFTQMVDNVLNTAQFKSESESQSQPKMRSSDVVNVDPSNKAKTAPLDASLAAEWVSRQDYWVTTYRNLFKFHKCDLRHLEIFYEDLIGSHSINYFNTIYAWLGMALPSVDSAQSQPTMLREHGRYPCYQRIANWDSVKPALVGTNSYWACQKQHSRLLLTHFES